MADPLNVVIDLSHYNKVTSFPISRRWYCRRDPQGDAGRRGPRPDLCFAARPRRRSRPVVGRLSLRQQYGWRSAGALLSLHRQSCPQDLLALDFEQNGDHTITLAQAEQFVTEAFHKIGRYPGFDSDSLVGSLLGGSVNETLAMLALARGIRCDAERAADVADLDDVAVHRRRARRRP